MKIISSAFENNSKIPAKYTCDGENVNPPLSFSDIPSNAKSLALIMDDPDAPSGTWVHWIVFNINPKITSVEEGTIPAESKEGITSFGKKGYGGACPPNGTHRYFFKLYALDAVLNLTNPDKTTLEKEMQGHILDKAELIGLYSRT
jgi:Raf kinase inhibitor-like YbhB/YbcL family protein